MKGRYALTTCKEYLKSLTGGEGFDDVFVFAPVKAVFEIVERNKGLWCHEAEKYLLENWK